MTLIAPALLAFGAEVGTNDQRVSDMAGLGTTAGRALDTSAAYNSSAQEYLIVWSGTEADVTTNQDRLYGQRINARTGAEVGANDYLVSEVAGAPDPDLDAQGPRVVYNSIANEYFVIFVGNPNPATPSAETDVFGQRLSGSDGARIGSAFQISTCGVAGDTLADVGTTIDSPIDVAFNATNNQYLVVLRCDDVGDSGAVNSEFEIYGRLVNANGTVVGTNDFQISFVGGSNGSASGDYDAEAPDVAWNSDLNEYLVIYGSEDAFPSTISYREIYGRRVSSTGALLGASDTRISNSVSHSFPDSSTGAVTYNPVTDQYLVVWGGDRLVDDLVQVHGQFLNAATLATVGTDDFQIGANKTDSTNPNIEVVYNSLDDEFLVSWNRGAADSELTVQRIDANGAALGSDDQVVTSMAFSAQGPSALTYNSRANSYLLAWAGSDDQGGQISGENELFTQILSEPVDMQVTKAAGPARPAPGDLVTYTLTYANAGPNRITDAVLTDSVSASLTGVSCTVGAHTGSTPVLRGGTTCTFDIDTLLSGQGGTITITGTVVGTLNADGTFTGAPADGTVIGNTVNLTSTSPHLDSNGANNTSPNAPVTVDYPPRVVSITRVGATPTNAASVQWLVTFSEPVTGGAAGNFGLVSGGGLSGASVTTVSGSGTTRTVTASTGTGSGTLGLNLTGGAGITDMSAGKALVGTPPIVGAIYTIDKTPPTVTIDQGSGQADPTNAGPIVFDVVFSESVTGFSGADISFAGSSLGGLVAGVTGGPSTYTVSVTGMTGSGTVVAAIPAGAASDAAGNQSLTSTSTDNSVSFDGVAPTVTINQGSGQADPTGGSPIVFDVVFSESVTGFTSADVSLSGTAGATTAGVSGSGASYTVSVSGMSSDGTVIAAIPAGGATDAAGNLSTASTSTDSTVTFIFDTADPTVTIDQAPSQSDPTNSSPITFRVVFSEPVSGFTSADVTLGGTAGATSASVTGGPSTYTVAVSGMTADGTVTAILPAGAASDTAGNPSAASTSTDNEVTYETVAPTVTIDQAAGQADPTNTGPIIFDVVFSESVTGFTAADVSFTGSTVGGTLSASVSGSGDTYTVSVTGMTGSGTVVAAIPAGNATDAAGNLNTASTSADNSVSFDGIGPTVTINQAAGQADPTNTGPIVFDVVFSESVTGFTATDVSFTGGTVGGTLSASVSGSGDTYTVSVTGMTGSGTVVAAIPFVGAAADTVGNLSAPSTSTDNTVTFDAIGPTVTVEQAAGQDDPTNNGPINFTVTFSEPVVNFESSDVSIGGTAGATTALVTGGPAVYTVAVSGMTSNGTVTAAIPFVGAAADLAGNQSAPSASTDNTVTFDAIGPTVTVEQAAGQSDPTNAGPVTFTVTFSEDVIGFTGGDLALSGTAGATTALVTGGPAVYTVAVSGMTADGTVIAAIPFVGAATDLAGNLSAPGTSADNTVTFDATGPAVTIEQAAGQSDPTSGSPIAFSVVFSEDVSGFTSADLVIGGTAGATSATVSGSNASYTVEITGMTSDGVVIAEIAAGAASDAAGNLSAASTSTDNSVTFISTPSDVTIEQAAGQADPTNAGPILFTVSFSRPVTGFTDSDVALSGTAGATSAAVTGGPSTYTVAVSGMTGDGTVIAAIPANVATDSFGKGNNASTSADNTVAYDATAPTAAIGEVTPDPRNTAVDSIAISFSEDVAGFDLGDLSLTRNGSPVSLAGATLSGSGSSYTLSDISGLTGAGGSYLLTLTATGSGIADATGNGLAGNATDSWVNDDTAPTTTATVSGTQKAGCPAGCFSGSATVTLTSNEPGTTFYRVNGITWLTYSGPFAIASEGANLVEFYSVDSIGNTEAPAKSVIVKVTTFADTSVLDTFNRANGPLGNNWRGVEGLGGYAIRNNAADVFGGGPIYWDRSSFGAQQEAFITFKDLDEGGDNQALLLKVQGAQGARWQKRDMIIVSYDAVSNQISIETHRVNRGWRTVATFSATLVDGDTLGARALSNGEIRVYINCELAAAAAMAPDDKAFFNPKGGRIGLWMIASSDTLLDNFGGGTYTP